MEPSSNGKTPKTSGTGQQQQQQQQNGSTTSGGSSGRIQNGSQKHRPTMKPSTSGIMAATPSSSTSSSLPTPIASSSSSSSSWHQFRFATTLPLRILVLKDLVGAIIGRGGGTIRQITQDTHARVDVHRKENSTSNENVIMIYGNPDNCSQACRRILEVMQQEAKSLNRPDEISLKILAANNLIGRIIGKGGNTIKRIMQQTDTKITISSANIASQYPMERIITISGQLDNMCKAEMMISQKLRQCYESDCMQYQQQSYMYTGFHPSIPPLIPPGQSGLSLPGYVPGPSHQQQTIGSYPIGAPPTCTNLPPSALVGRQPPVLPAVVGSSVSSPPSSGTGAGPSSQQHPMPSTSTQGPAFYNPYNLPFMYPTHSPAGPSNINAPFSSGPSSASYMNIGFLNPMLPNLDNIKETVTIFIPNSVVGAIIGRGGSTIREMMSNSGAIIKVAQMSEEDTTASSSTDGSNKLLERRVTIFGNSFSQNQAQFFVFQKVFQELSNQLSTITGSPGSICPYGDPSILKVEILVPTNQVRRIIGKGGSVITDLQRTSGATIKLSKDSSSSSQTTTTSSKTTASTSSTTTTEQQQEPSTPPSPNGADSTTEKSTTTSTGQQTQPTQTAATSASSSSSSDQDMTSVYIIGDFYASFNAQRQIRLIVHRSIPGSSSSTTATTTTSSVPSTTATSKSSTIITTTTTSTSSSTKSGDGGGGGSSLEESEPSQSSVDVDNNNKQQTESTTIKTTTTTTTTESLSSSTDTVEDNTTTTTATSSNTATDSPACTPETTTASTTTTDSKSTS